MVSSGFFSTKSEVVTRGALSELAWNDPMGTLKTSLFIIIIIIGDPNVDFVFNNSLPQGAFEAYITSDKL